MALCDTHKSENKDLKHASAAQPEFITSLTDHGRRCSQGKDFDPLANKSKQICIFIEQEEYDRIWGNSKAFRQYLDDMILQHPELFPVTIQQGYILHGILPESKKMTEIRLRRIKVKAKDGNGSDVFTIRPSFVMPYMIGYTDDVEKTLFLRRWGVPYWALAYVFGRNEQYWYRIDNHIGRNSVVGTTVKNPDDLPEDLLADEKHTRFNGQKMYIATTVANDCVLGASVSLNAGTEGLTEAYGHFKTEANNVSHDYEPKTVSTDGWTATKLAWQHLFPMITAILCFLHSFIKIRDRCKRMKGQYGEIKTRVWEIYHSDDKHTFTHRITEFKEWAIEKMPKGNGLDAILKLCNKAPEFVKAYDHPTAYRTSNMLDRHMDPMARYLHSCRYFHGHLTSAEYSTRSWALLHNFHPYSPRAKAKQKYESPAHKFNDFVYHDNWLHNLLISASMGGYRQ
jgi:hypothetical protein